MRVLRDFDKFINPDETIDFYDLIDVNCLEYCSYVDYIGIYTINGEIESKPIYLQLEEVKNFILNNDCFVIAFNHCDSLVMEVDLII